MRLHLILFGFLAALASPVQAAMSRSALRSLIQSRKSGRPLTAQERLQQEQALYQHLKTLNAEQITLLEKKLPSALLQRVIQRVSFLKQQEKRNGRPGASSLPNMVVSGASSVRKSSSPNSLGGKGPGSPAAAAADGAAAAAGSGRGSGSGKGSNSRSSNFARMTAMARKMMAARLRRPRPRTPMDTLRGYRSFSSEARGALREGCTYPIATESVMESFFAGVGGCTTGAAVCYMKGQSCVNVGMSMMCCPPGFSSGTLHALHQMKQMQTLMNSFM